MPYSVPMATMSFDNSIPVLDGFSVYQPAVGAPLQFFPPLGSQELDDLIDAYIPGNASLAEKRGEISIDFFKYTIETGADYKFYQVFNSWSSPSTTDSPMSTQDSAYGSAFDPSPVIPGLDWNLADLDMYGFPALPQAPSSGSSPSSSSSRPVAPALAASPSAASSTSSRKSSTLSSSSRTSSSATTQIDFSNIPGMKIMTRDGRDVTNSASRGCKTKEQRDHAHLMRIIKACDSCRRKKVRCDPSHKKRSGAATSAAAPVVVAPSPRPRAIPSDQQLSKIRQQLAHDSIRASIGKDTASKKPITKSSAPYQLQSAPRPPPETSPQASSSSIFGISEPQFLLPDQPEDMGVFDTVSTPSPTSESELWEQYVDFGSDDSTVFLGAFYGSRPDTSSAHLVSRARREPFLPGSEHIVPLSPQSSSSSVPLQKPSPAQYHSSGLIPEARPTNYSPPPILNEAYQESTCGEGNGSHIVLQGHRSIAKTSTAETVAETVGWSIRKPLSIVTQGDLDVAPEKAAAVADMQRHDAVVHLVRRNREAESACSGCDWEYESSSAALRATGDTLPMTSKSQSASPLSGDKARTPSTTSISRSSESPRSYRPMKLGEALAANFRAFSTAILDSSSRDWCFLPSGFYTTDGSSSTTSSPRSTAAESAGSVGHWLFSSTTVPAATSQQSADSLDGSAVKMDLVRQTPLSSATGSPKTQQRHGQESLGFGIDSQPATSDRKTPTTPAEVASKPLAARAVLPIPSGLAFTLGDIMSSSVSSDSTGLLGGCVSLAGRVAISLFRSIRKWAPVSSL